MGRPSRLPWKERKWLRALQPKFTARCGETRRIVFVSGILDMNCAIAIPPAAIPL
jgi:hypothetical protein